MTDKPGGPSAPIQALHPRAIRMALERVIENRKLSPHLPFLKPLFKDLISLKQVPTLSEADDLLIQSFVDCKDHDAEDEWVDRHLQALLHS